MDEKYLLVGEDRPLPPPKGPSKLRHMIKNVVFVMLMAVVSFHLLLRASDTFCSHRKPGDGISIRYPGESIEWTPCGEVDGRQLECSSIETPYDHWNKDSSSGGNQTFTIALNRLRGKNATKNMLINPGGPGGSGLDLVRKGGKQLRTIIGEGHHILGFDPRGVGESTPLAICYPDEETRKLHAIETPTDPKKDSGYAYAYYKALSQACADTMPEYGKYINTPQTAADMNSILDAVGQDGLVYWGFSYGTILGQTYANLFPERSDRVIIDGVFNQFAWYNYIVDNTTFVDTNHVVEGFFTECIKAGDKCMLSSLADKAEDLQNNVTSLVNSLRDDPMSIYIDKKSYGVIQYDNIWLDAIFPATYSPAIWYRLADNLANLMSGDGSKALKEYVLGEQPWGQMLLEHNMVISHNDRPSGKDVYPQARKEIMDFLSPLFNETSDFIDTVFSDYFSRALWQVPKQHPFTPPQEKVETRHPMLILSTTYDPVCPLSSAKVAQESFKYSMLVEVQGYGHCSIAVQSACIAKHVRAFLNNGTVLDEKHSKCKVDGEYFIVPADKAVKTSDVELSEEEELLVAQQELSELLGSFRF